MRALAIETFRLTKRFGAFTALDQVSIKIRAGTVHALLGENGAGKSTFVKCLVGYHPADDGGVMVDGREQWIEAPQQARALGIGMVYQHFTLVPSMTVAENLVLAKGGVPFVVPWQVKRAELDAFMQRMPFRLPLDAPASSLSAGERQKVEILKQLYADNRFLILDEPTSVLTPEEADEVLAAVRELTRRGELTVLMITHKFREVLAYADDVSVLRRGQYVGGGPLIEFNAERLAELMIGGPRHAPAVADDAAAPTARGAPVLQIDALEVDNDAGRRAVRNVSLAVHGGEIVGIAGVSGNGQRELVETLLAQRTAVSGSIRVDGQPYRGTRAQLARHRVGSLPEEPLRNASVARLSVADNMALRNYDVPPLARGIWRIPRAATAQAQRWIAAFRVKTRSPADPIATLSGGNVQRAVLARELSRDCRLLIVMNPVFGLDFAAVDEIHERLLAARRGGAAILLVSEDLDELLELSDRVLVMSGGRIAFETDTPAAARGEIGRHMGGHADHSIAEAA
jgi:simple sugar transport system ATP-binding protein